MDANTVFATGGVSGASVTAMYLIYRFFFSKHRITSRCCGREFTLEVEGSSPIENKTHIIENELHKASLDGRHRGSNVNEEGDDVSKPGQEERKADNESKVQGE